MVLGRTLHLVVASAVGVAIGGATGLRLLDSMNEAVPELRAALVANEDSPAMAGPIRRKVVVVLIDGASGDALERHVDAGVLGDVPWRARVDVGVPSLSRPVYHALLTGTPQWVSGIRSDGYARARADSVPARVRDAGGRVGWALETVNWFDELFGEPEDARVPGAGVDDPERAIAGIEDRALSIVHLTRTDHVGHMEGAASPAYDQAVASALEVVARMRARMDGRTIWFVGSDHGHLPRGGHGGPEDAVRFITWVALGDGVIRRTFADHPPVGAMAPTIASALGVPPPRHALEPGLPLLSGEPPLESPRAPLRRVAAAAAQGDHQRRQLGAKLVRAAVLAAGVALLAWTVGARRALLAGGFVACCVAAFLLLGPGITISAIRTQAAFIAHGVGVVALAAAASWAALRRKGGGRATDAIWAATLVAAGVLVETGGSLGRSDPSDVGMLLYPASGLLPPGAVAGVLLVECIRLATCAVARRMQSSRIRGRRS